MDINTVVLIIILAVMLYAVSSHLQEKGSIVEREKQQSISEKEELSKEEVGTYGQVQERKSQLLNLISEKLSDYPEESNQLKDIIEDWSELKIESFQNRRSWVRASNAERKS